MSSSKHSGHIVDRGPLMMGIDITMLTVAVAATVIRSFLRRRSVGRLRMEDWCCIGATFVLINMVIAHGFGTRYGIGKHIWDLHLDKAQKTSGIKTGYIGRIIYPFATGLIRQSVLCLLLRIFPYKTFRRVVIVMIVINVLVTILSSFLIVFQCVPLRNVFNTSISPYGPRPGCLSSRGLAFSVPAFNLTLDIIVALLPVRMIMTISLPGKSKLVILGMLGLGALACVASGMRLIIISRSYGKYDAQWVGFDICLWASAEVTIGVVCVSAPVFRPLFAQFRRKSAAAAAHKSSTVHISNNTESGGGSKSTVSKTATRISTKGSFVLASLKRPERAKVRLQMRDGSSSVEQFRPNDVNRTITEIEARDPDGRVYERSQDETSSDDVDDRAELMIGSRGILRRMEVAVTVSDRV